jgi:hypothetical protein
LEIEAERFAITWIDVCIERDARQLPRRDARLRASTLPRDRPARIKIDDLGRVNQGEPGPYVV